MSFFNSVINKISDLPVTTAPSPSQPQVAAVLDDFSILCFAADANLWLIDPQQFSLDIERIRPDFLLVESAWHGNAGKWRYMVNSGSGPQWPLIKLVETCKQQGIPTVFWNKEDPPHFQEYLPTAKLFDYVFTSDGDMIPRYREAVNAKGVDLLRFAANPTIHNPSRVEGYRRGDIAFAGQYFADKFPERRQQMENLFEPATRYEFAIYSRGLGGKSIYQFPPKWDKYVVGSLPYDQMVKAYRQHKIFLNVNSVTTSSTMCARRVFELSAAKTSVVGMDSPAVRSVYSDSQILLAEDPAEVRQIYRTLLEGGGSGVSYRATTQAAWRHTLSHHTYYHRLKQISEMIGQGAREKACDIYIVSRGDTSNTRRLLSDVERQAFTFTAPVRLSFIDGEDSGRSRVISQKGWSESASFESERYLAFMPDGYRFGRFYLNDLVLAAQQQNAQLVAKHLGAEAVAPEETWTENIPLYGWLAYLGVEPITSDLVAQARSGALAGQQRIYISDPVGIDSLDSRSVSPLLDV